jgi:hypothetical protein
MAAAPSPRPGLLAGLAKILHLHQLPRAEEKLPLNQSKPETGKGEIPPIPTTFGKRTPISNTKNETIIPLPMNNPSSSALPAIPLKKNNSPPSIAINASTAKSPSTPRWPVNTHPSSNTPVTKGMIITDYDKILELVKTHHPVKLDEIARILVMKEEQVAQELQTLEDNGLVEVKYPAFGEPLIYYKQPEA